MLMLSREFHSRLAQIRHISDFPKSYMWSFGGTLWNSRRMELLDPSLTPPIWWRFPKGSNDYPVSPRFPKLKKQKVHKVLKVPKVSKVPNAPKVPKFLNLPRATKPSGSPKVSKVPNIPKVLEATQETLTPLQWKTSSLLYIKSTSLGWILKPQSESLTKMESCGDAVKLVALRCCGVPLCKWESSEITMGILWKHSVHALITQWASSETRVWSVWNHNGSILKPQWESSLVLVGIVRNHSGNLLKAQ